MAKPQLLQVRCTQSGFVVGAGGSSELHTSLEWRDVDVVLAYKRSLYTVDLVCLGFVTPNGAIEVHEEMHGWSELVQQLPSRLFGLPPLSDWWERVAKPPFASSMTKLFERADRVGT